jgi:hypothetical protein
MSRLKAAPTYVGAGPRYGGAGFSRLGGSL